MVWVILTAFLLMPVIQAGEVRVFMEYVSRAITEHNTLKLYNQPGIRPCLEECVRQNVINLRSADFGKPGGPNRGRCYCQEVNKYDVPQAFATYADYNTYQYTATLITGAGARMYVCDSASLSTSRTARCIEAQPTASVNYVVMIVEEGSLVPSPSLLVKSRMQCSALCLRHTICTAIVLQENNDAFYCSLYNNIHV